MLEHDRGLALSPSDVPERRAERARALGPVAVLDVVRPVRQRAPVIELRAIDAPRPRRASGRTRSWRRRRRRRPARPARARAIWIAIEPRPPAPPQTSTDVALLDHVRRPADEHAVRGGRDEHVRGRLLPRQVRRLRQALMRLHARELREAAPVRSRSPRSVARREHRILARLRPPGRRVPHPAVHDDLVADLDVRDVAADLPTRRRTRRCRRCGSPRARPSSAAP